MGLLAESAPPLGDAHNFGQRVTLQAGSQPAKLHKPRSVFWEFVFLNENSPFRNFLRDLTAPNKTFDSLLGNLVVETSPDGLSGLSTFLEPDVVPALAPSDLGGLVALAMTFGFTDLHLDNLLIVDGKIQIVDLECLFWSSELPSESLLIPRTTERLNRTLLAYFSQPLLPSELQGIIEGYIQTLGLLLSYRQKIVTFISQQLMTWQKQPLRLLLRETKEYHEILAGTKRPNAALLPEETLQLARSDVPYFWGYLGRREIWYFTEPGVPRQVHVLSAELEKKIARAFVLPDDLLSQSRLTRILRQGVMEMVFRLVDYQSLPMEQGNLKIQIAEGKLRVETPHFNVETALRRV